ncbi:MAG: family 16 glycosylhydrolase [Dysgonamonadaceae bacterium]|jgi:beta-glucanase (GH16 family)|nr:family 16 glycosylhydrolase [Dysgonamonadaceae bacterium]
MKKTAFFIFSLLTLVGLTTACDEGTDPKPPTPPSKTITDISFDQSTVNLEVGDNEELDYNITPSNGNKTTIVWSSSNERVAEVDDDGYVTAIGYGKAVITAETSSVISTVTIKVAEPKRTYKLVWSDEFNGSSVDRNKWTYDVGGNGWGNKQKEYDTDGLNTRIENGFLVIEARKETFKFNDYTSTRMNTKNNASFRYGKWEARISVPSGRGTWPAFWLMPTKSEYGGWPMSGEIDIMEHVGSDPRMISHAVHTGQYSGGNAWDYQIRQDNVENNYHIYAIEWIDNYQNGNDAILFYVDGKLSTIKDQGNYATSKSSDWPFDKNFYVILNLAIGGTWGGTIDDSIFPVQMKVDYVRIYQLVK